MAEFDIWQFLGGLAIFLLGLYFMEQALKELVGRPFKKFLRDQTTNPLKGVLGGTVVTAVLQSSSVVSLMVLAFVGAGILALKNAIGIIFGTNLGTTATGWLVALLGFKLDIEAFAMPMVAIGGMLFVFFTRKEKLQEFGRFILGFGLLFIGLAWMKESIELFAINFNLSAYQGMSPYWFILIGMVLTAIIQSSSASMVITLSALNSGIISLDAGAAMVIGSNLGTTITVILGAANGTAVKKQVAASHFMFNMITSIAAIALIHPLLSLIIDLFQVTDPLITLVSFHSIFNLMGILILLPFIGLLAKGLKGRFNGKNVGTSFINTVPTDVPEAAIEALNKEVLRFTKMVLNFNAQGLHIRQDLFSIKDRLFVSKDLSKNYDQLKQLEGEIVAYYLKVQKEKMEEDTGDDLDRISKALENAMISAKNVKDVAHNVKAFSSSSNDVKLALYKFLKGRLFEFYLGLHHLFGDGRKATRFEALLELKEEDQAIYEKFLKETHTQIRAGHLNDVEISTLLNVNREIYNANKALIMALKDLLLSSEEARDFDKLPEVHKV